MPQHPKTVGIASFKGLNNVLRPERTPKEYLKTADNVDIDKSGGIQKREGYTLIDSGSYHSVWADGNLCFAVKDGDLVQLDPQLNPTVVVPNVGLDPISYFRIENSVYYSSRSVNGVLENGTSRDWGISRPNPYPTLSQVTGSLESGKYQVAITYASIDGRESGARVSGEIEVSTGSGIQLSGIPESEDPTVDMVNIYMSHDNGQVLYYKASVSNGTSSYVLADDTGLRRPLDTFNQVPAPKGHIVAQAHSRAWIAEDNYLWHSDPFQYEHFSLADSYIHFPDRIRAVMPVEGGLWVASDGLYYLAGEDPERMDLDLKEPIKVVEGSAVRIPGAYVFIENTPIGYKWIISSNRGIYVLFNDGIALNMTSQNYEFPSADEGAATFMQVDGLNKYISLLKQPKSDSENATVGDLVTATIIRNGVVVPE